MTFSDSEAAAIRRWWLMGESTEKAAVLYQAKRKEEARIAHDKFVGYWVKPAHLVSPYIGLAVVANDDGGTIICWRPNNGGVVQLLPVIGLEVHAKGRYEGDEDLVSPFGIES